MKNSIHIYYQLKTALKEQDWVEVARCALEMDRVEKENTIINIERYYAKEGKFQVTNHQTLRQEASSRAFGKVLTFEGRGDKKSGKGRILKPSRK